MHFDHAHAVREVLDFHDETDVLDAVGRIGLVGVAAHARILLPVGFSFKPEPGSRAVRLPSLARDGALKLGLRHLRAAVHAEALRLLVELLLRPTARSLPVRPDTAPAAGGDVLARQPRRLARLAGPGTFLVHRPGRDLFRTRFPAVLERILDVLVLTRSLRALLHATRRHGVLLSPIRGPTTPSRRRAKPARERAQRPRQFAARAPRRAGARGR